LDTKETARATSRAFYFPKGLARPMVSATIASGERRKMPEDHRLNAETGKHSMSGNDAKLTLQRSPASLTYIYVLLGFALTIEGEILAMIEPLKYPFNLVVLFVSFVLTVLLFRSGKFQNFVLATVKDWFEKGRSH
jgi:hypothetical protein